MSFSQKIVNEIKSLAAASLFFAVWIGVFILLKTLMLDEYEIRFNGFSKILIGTLILAKVVLILERVSLGNWIRNHPAWVHVAVRTVLYTTGVFMVILLEKSFEQRHNYAGWIPAIQAVIRRTNEYHVLVNTICLTGALLVYNALFAIRQQLGPGKLKQIFMSPVKKNNRDS